MLAAAHVKVAMGEMEGVELVVASSEQKPEYPTAIQCMDTL